MDDYDPVEDSEDDDESLSERLDELERRIEELDSNRGEAGCLLGYAMGMSLAMILSWSRSASVLWSLLHGVLSWGYVIYFAFTR